MTPSDAALYARVKASINLKYTKNSAYRSMAYIKEYKRRGGDFIPDGKSMNLKRWQQEKWKDVNPKGTKKSYPVYRPTIRVSEKTPTTVDEITKAELMRQARIKQKIRGVSNLKPFLRRTAKKRKSVKGKGSNC